MKNALATLCLVTLAACSLPDFAVEPRYGQVSVDGELGVEHAILVPQQIAHPRGHGQSDASRAEEYVFAGRPCRGGEGVVDGRATREEGEVTEMGRGGGGGSSGDDAWPERAVS